MVLVSKQDSVISGGRRRTLLASVISATPKSIPSVFRNGLRDQVLTRPKSRNMNLGNLDFRGSDFAVSFIRRLPHPRVFGPLQGRDSMLCALSQVSTRFLPGPGLERL